MRPEEYLQRDPNGSDGRKIIITDKISLANSMLRKINISERIDIFDAEPKTIRDICMEIITAYDILKRDIAADFSPRKLLSPQAEIYVMEDVLRNGQFKTISVDSISIPTASDVLDCVSELRLNGTTQEWDKSTDAKVSDIKMISATYTKHLSDLGALDLPSMIEESVQIIGQLPLDADSGMSVTLDYLIPWICNAHIGIMSTCILSALEKQLIDMIASTALGVSVDTIDVVDYDPQNPGAGLFTSDRQGKVLRAYGVANEVEYVARTINAEDVQYGDIQVFYSNSTYLNYIKASFDHAHIPYVLTNGYSAKELNLTQLMLSLIDAAREDFSYELLHEAIINPVITFENVAEEHADNVFVNPVKAYNDVLHDGIGWGIKRTIGYLDRAKKELEETLNGQKRAQDPSVWDKRVKNSIGKVRFGEFLQEYISVFTSLDESTGEYRDHRVAETLQKLWDFVRRYSYKKNRDRGKLTETIYQAISDLEYLNDKGMDMNKRLDILQSVIEGIKVSDDSDPGAVSVSLMRGMQVIERDRVYVIGLSAGMFNMDTKQSPILLDDEKKKYIKGVDSDQMNSPVELASNRNRIRRRDAYATLKTMTEGNISFTYNYYDTVGLKESSPSVFYMEIAEALEQTDPEAIPKVPGYDILKQDIRIDAETMRDVLKKQGEELAERKKQKKEEQAKKRAEREAEYRARIEAGEDVEDTADSIQTGEEIRSDVIGDTDDLYGASSSVVSDTANDKGSKESGSVPYRLRMSATGLQTFLACPLQYYYNYIKFLKVYDQKSPSGYQWLNSFNKGNLFHYSAEQYFTEIDPASGQVNEIRLREIIHEQAEIIEQSEPYLSQVVRNREEQEYYDMALAYIRYITEHWNDDKDDDTTDTGWKIIGCEVKFGEEDGYQVEYDGKDPNHPVRIAFNGSIDRMDGRLRREADEDSGKEKIVLYIRIIDYKTGKKESKDKEIDAGVQVQHFIYAMAAIEYCRNNGSALKDLFDTEVIDEYAIDYIGYEFPYETPDNYSLDSTNQVFAVEGNVLCGALDDLEVRFDQDMEKNIDDILGAYQKGSLDNIPTRCDEMIRDRIIEELSKILDKKNKAEKERADKKYAKDKQDYDKKLAKYNEDVQKGKDPKKPEEPEYKEPKQSLLEDIKGEFELKNLCEWCDYPDVCRMYVRDSRYEI